MIEWRKPLLFVRPYILFLIVFLSSCSPTYVLRAGFEEANILLKRRDLSEIIHADATEPRLREKFQLVLQARAFASEIGLEPKGSFLQYSAVNRNVLVWVLTASPKNALSPITWWFPIVGKVPYKGYFEKDDALNAAKKLAEKDFDIYVRPSAAFSTLGWFNDPLLSTIVAFDEVSLVDTVIHEIVHNTIWIKDDVAFNETLANFIGARGSEEFFLHQEQLNDQEKHRTMSISPLPKIAEDRWHDELLFAHFIEEIINRLEDLYSAFDRTTSNEADGKPKFNEREILTKREKIFSDARLNWMAASTELKTNRYNELALKLNNAILIAHRVYLTKPWLFENLYQACGKSLPKFVDAMKRVEKRVNDSQTNPFQEVMTETGRITA